MTVLEVDGLHTRFPTPRGTVDAVNEVDLRIESGEILGLVGESSNRHRQSARHQGALEQILHVESPSSCYRNAAKVNTR